MRKFLILSLILVFAVSSAFAAKSTFSHSNIPVVTDNGGPDDFGYSWEDNDNGGTPVYSWVDISSVGTPVQGLVDDNVVGTFNIGFDFPYYWYLVDHVYIGANGFISFSSGDGYSQDFAQLPNRTSPNDIVAPLACDLDFSSPYGDNLCYYYTNNVDSFVVSWIDVSEWRSSPIAGTEHTFQLILCASDSSITFQYGAQNGDWQNPDGATSIGIEDLVGGTGISYLHNLEPSANRPHDGLVVRFHPTPDPQFVFEDVGITGVMNQQSGGEFRRVNQPMIVSTYVKNTGTVGLDDITVNCKIKRSYWTEYNENFVVSHLDAGEETLVEFPLTYTPETDEVYSVVTKTMLTDDFFYNNSDTCEMRTYIPFSPSFFLYADTVVEFSSWEGGGGGFANEFVIPDPITITDITACIMMGGSPSYWYIYPANADGAPDEDNPLFTATLTAPDTNWMTVHIDEGVNIDAGQKFFAGVLSGGDDVAFGVDTSWPLSKRGWEQVGSYTVSRDRGEHDICILVTGETRTGIDDDNVKLPTSFALNQNYPNPFNATTEITFDTKDKGVVNLEVYNIAGQKIKTLANGSYDAGSHRVIWDGTNDAGTVISSGVYFYKLSVDNQSETKKMVLLK